MFDKIKKFFNPVESLEADEAKKFIDDHEEGSYTLLDVRQPGEYEESHIPGAKLIPITKLSDSMDELDPEKPVLVYCAIGGRSRVAAQMLAANDFKLVYNMKGGIKAWNGSTAEGPVELNLGLISGDESPADIIILAYGMEAGLARFYDEMLKTNPDQDLNALLKQLSSMEAAHKNYLHGLYKAAVDPTTSKDALEKLTDTKFMEGGFSVSDFIRANQNYVHDPDSILNLSLMLETQALDLYLRFSFKIEEGKGRDILRKIADEEKSHLELLGRLLERRIKTQDL